jgi:hypothetical protein
MCNSATTITSTTAVATASIWQEQQKERGFCFVPISY